MSFLTYNVPFIDNTIAQPDDKYPASDSSTNQSDPSARHQEGSIKADTPKGRIRARFRSTFPNSNERNSTNRRKFSLPDTQLTISDHLRMEENIMHHPLSATGHIRTLLSRKRRCHLYYWQCAANVLLV